jgi:pimeloyl-ACP methyl ester carboxylesterase
MDIRGHGESGTIWNDYTVAGIGRDMLALIRKLDAGPAILIGTSMSAGGAVWAAAESPELVQALVLIGPAVRGELTRSQSLMFGALFARPWGPTVWHKYYNTLYPTHKPADLEQYTRQLRSNLAEKGRLETLVKMIKASKVASETRLPQVKAPSLIVMGSKDPDFKDPEAEARLVADSVNGSYHMVPDAGHYPQAEMPDLTGSIILSFLQSIKVESVHES